MNAREDPIWQMVAILNGKVEGDELVAVLSAFVDESGTGDEPKVVLAAIVSDVNGWLNFNAEWQAGLDADGLEYAHYTDMRQGRGRYEGWSIKKKDGVSRRNFATIKQNCLFGFTVSLDKELYKSSYLKKCQAERMGADSAYALCAREVFGYAIHLARTHFQIAAPMNFIFESGHRNSTNAAAVFNDLKAHSVEKDSFGFFSLEDKKKLKPLQGADHLAHQGRRGEPKALKEGFIEVLGNAYADALVSVQQDGCPVFYWPITEEMLDFYREQHRVLRKLKIREKRGRNDR